MLISFLTNYVEKNSKNRISRKFRTIETVNLNIKLLLSLEFVPETQIADYYEELVEQIFKRDQKTDYSELLSFLRKIIYISKMI
jgi:hypothetical protein